MEGWIKLLENPLVITFLVLKILNWIAKRR